MQNEESNGSTSPSSTTQQQSIFSQQIEATIESIENLGEGIFYVIQLSVNNNKWKTRKSYEDFKKLHKVLVSSFSEEREIPAFRSSRSKSVFGKKKKANLKTATSKRDTCQKFLSEVLSDPFFRASTAVLVFLEVKSRHGSINMNVNKTNEMSSWMRIKPKLDTVWKDRFLVIKDDLLYYFKDDLRSGNTIEPLGYFTLYRTLVTDSLSSMDGKRIQREKQNAFKIETTDGDTIYLSFMVEQKNPKQLKDQWISALKQSSSHSVYNFDFCRSVPDPLNKLGFLTKLGAKVHNWKTRYFNLDNSTLSYFKTEDSTKELGKVELTGTTVRLHSTEESMSMIQRDCAISIDTPKRKWWITGHSRAEMEEWERALLQASIRMRGGTKYVDSAKSLYTVLASASDGDIIRVEPGNYGIEGLDVTKSVTIRAADPSNKPIFESLSKKAIIEVKARCVVIDAIIFKAKRADCLCLTSGNTVAYECEFTSKEGIAIRLQEQALLIINSCTIVNCEEGTALLQQGGRLHMEKCRIDQNDNGVFVSANYSYCEINNCSFTYNNSGVICNANQKTTFHVQRCKLSENISCAINIMKIPDTLKIFDNSMINNKDVAIKVEPSLVADRKLQECIIDNFVQNSAGEGIKLADPELATQLAIATEVNFMSLDVQIVVHILKFVSFPLGQCLTYLRSEWLDSSDEVYEQKEGFIFRNLYGYQKTADSNGKIMNSSTYLLYSSLDLSITDEDIDLFIPFNNGLIPTKNVHALLLNETWVERNGLKMVALTHKSLRNLNLGHCSNLKDDMLEDLYFWLDSLESGVKAHLDLTGTSVTMNSLSKLQNVSVLRLRPINFSSSDTTVLEDFVQKCGSQLEDLELSYYPLGTNGAEIVFNSIQNCKRIALMGVNIGKTEDYSFENGELILDAAEDIAYLFQLLLENTVLTHLNVKDNYVGDEGVDIIATYPALRSLNLEECGVSSQGMQWILSRSSTIESLNLAVNALDDSALDQVPLQSNTTLKSLNLSFNKGISSQGYKNLVANLSIHTLTIHGCAGQLTDEVVQELCSMQNLTSLHVSGNELTHLALINIGQSKITHLDISYNFVGDEGAVILAECPSLKSLSMGSNKVTFIGARELFGSNSIEYLDLSQNIDIQDSIISTFEALQDNTVLKHLILANIENISQHKTLEILITKNKTLESINLQGTNVSGEYLRLLVQQKLMINPNLRSLSLSDEDGPEILATVGKAENNMRIFIH